MFKASLALLILAISPAHAQTDPQSQLMAERAFEGAQWIMATKAARAVAQTGARAAQGDGPLAVLIRQRQQIEAELNETRALYATQGAVTRQELLDIEQSLLDMDADIRAKFPNYAEFANPRPLGYPALRAHLAPNEGLVMFLSAPNSTYIWAISHQGEAWHRADLPAATLSAQIRNLRADLDPTAPVRAAVALSAPTPPSGPSFDAQIAHDLYASLFAPLMPALEGVDHLYVVKDGPLASLPLSVLLSEPASDLQDTVPWLIRRFAFTTLPGVSSLSSIAASSRMSRSQAELGKFVGFGDPDFRGGAAQNAPPNSRAMPAFFDGQGAVTDAIRTLPALPGTGRELREIAKLFSKGQALVVTGADATETAVKSAALNEVAILSFATHGLITGDITGLAEPALALTPPLTSTPQDDGLLTASEASELNLNADWVILSACNTAAGDGTPGAEGLSGLARAFLFAGARSILVSHWPVRDDVAAIMTRDTLARLQADPGMGKSQALRLAMLDLIEQTHDASLTHPSAWAPFVVVGDGGAPH